jgi:hypothetical protein
MNILRDLTSYFPTGLSEKSLVDSDERYYLISLLDWEQSRWHIKDPRKLDLFLDAI